MAYYTQIPDATIDLTATTPVLSLGNNLLLNELSGSNEFSQYDVDANSATTLTRGDDVSLVDTEQNPELTGTFAGTGTLSTATASIGIPLLANITIQLNPISGSYVVGEDGNTYFVTDEPLDASHIGLNIQGTVAGLPVNLADINLSELNSNPLLAPILGTLQQTLDTLIVNVAYDPEGTLPLDDEDVVPCFTAGTLIETRDGFVAVETLTVGDLVRTRDHGLQPVRWIGSVKLAAAALTAQPKLRPIRIKAGALGDLTPSTDLVVSPQHRVLVRSKIALKMFGAMEVLVAAKQLLQIEGVDIAEDVAEVEYFHILFENHEVVNSNGAATESLYTGTEALKSVGAAAREEIFALFPQLRDADFAPTPARPIPSGRKSRRMTVRHVQHSRPVFS